MVASLCNHAPARLVVILFLELYPPEEIKWRPASANHVPARLAVILFLELIFIDRVCKIHEYAHMRTIWTISNDLHNMKRDS